ncbi:glucose inhibited division protein B [Candidatus Kinetoplastibacterium blastocrithidii TCC012E]|uniref:Ribosomal RNA small subunit methyltransferase G n=1 Tax=Candidatus Kinetoplastidibacterium blastocrithidiae TCC012E TaxID=1208922 RepID=M1M1N1_9PROT|nr:16S rRNA (guanine(527)-N(7))-methyltransferase RsmG [Candidatus Kinetoplastibacterium blastocrithidii]AFZ83352.1 16S rRNA (guanine527-N7)-methyltransferase [Candidatus Kinetoplastibacterium blastocrithidii (ex Strigomonas culicis)]AGF50171.1 glucose inhibited division protein B [Candidatus Kinetoplastibacterium blastocrithidii TCC012E]
MHLYRNYLPDDFLSDYCSTLKIKISNEQKILLSNYLSMMQKWNKYCNITSVKNYKDMLVYHVVDSLSVLPFLDSFSKKNLRVCDVGSGAGLPGIVLAIMRSNCSISCIDSIFKKTSFLKYVSSSLLLSNVIVYHSRIENLKSLECDVVISRAFSSLSKFVELSGHHVKNDGILCSMKSLIPNKEIDDFSCINDWGISNIYNLNVPGINSQRCLVVIKRASN